MIPKRLASMLNLVEILIQEERTRVSGNAFVSEITNIQESHDCGEDKMDDAPIRAYHIIPLKPYTQQVGIKCADCDALMFGTHVGDIRMAVGWYENRKIITLKNAIHVVTKTIT